MCLFSLIVDGQSCINNPDVNRNGEAVIQQGRQVVVPDANFSCNGRITSVAVSMLFSGLTADFPLFQVWRPSTPNSSVYEKIGEVQLPGGDFIGDLLDNYFLANVLLSDSEQIEFQFGDIIGYYQPADPRRLIWSIETTGYTAYSNSVASPTDIIDISNVDNVENERQPLVAITFGKVMQKIELQSVILFINILVFKFVFY